eukprot:scaffold67017_cov30-Phaeocystis_antarctica.AAC.1
MTQRWSRAWQRMGSARSASAAVPAGSSRAANLRGATPSIEMITWPVSSRARSSFSKGETVAVSELTQRTRSMLSPTESSRRCRPVREKVVLPGCSCPAASAAGFSASRSWAESSSGAGAKALSLSRPTATLSCHLIEPPLGSSSGAPNAKLPPSRWRGYTVTAHSRMPFWK